MKESMHKISAESILTNRNFLILAIATIGMLPALVKTGGYYIGGDITTQMLPFVYETKRMFASGVPFWSWNTYFGDNFIASYAYYTVFNPFTWINCLFPYKYLGVGFTFVLYLKFLVCGYVTQKYLKKIGFADRLSLIGSLPYTFSSWAISSLLFYMFLEPMILFPFLLIFVERFLRHDKHPYTGLAISTFVVVTVNYYFSSANLIAAAMYFFCRLFYLIKRGNERIRIALGATGCVCLGIVCASFVLIPVLIQLNGSPHESINLDTFDLPRYLDRVLWLIYPKAHEGPFRYIFLNSRWYSNTASIAVFGLLPTLLFFTRRGHQWIKWLTVIMVVFYLTPLNGLFSLFTEMYYTRWAYALTLSFIVCTLYYIKDFGIPRMKYAVWYSVAVYGGFFLFAGTSIYWYWCHGGMTNILIIERLAKYVLIIAINTAALLLVCSRRSSYVTGVAAVAVCVTFQLMVYSLNGIRLYPTEKFFMTETEYFRNGYNYREDGDFKYRSSFTVMDSGNWPVSNFGLICNRASTGTYHSIQNTKIQKWKSIVSTKNHRSRTVRLNNFVESFESLMSVKDIVVVSNKFADSAILGKPHIRQDIFTIYESDHYIPMGFVYDKYILSDELEDIAKCDTIVDIPKVLLSVLAIDKADEKELMPYLKKGSINTGLSLDSLVSVRSALACDDFTGHTRGFDAHIDLDSTRIVFFSVLDDPGFSAYIDGESTKIFETNLGLSSVIVPAGSHEITFRYFTPGLKLGLIISLIGFVVMVRLFYKSL